MTQLSPHFSLEELVHTDTGLPNSPSVEQGADLVRLCDTILEPMRALLGPLKVNSGFRSQAVNDAIHGAHNSQHMKGQSADVVPMKQSLEFSFQWIKATTIPFDQLIIEPSWIHVSVSPPGHPPRRQTLRAHMTDQGMVYENE